MIFKEFEDAFSQFKELSEKTGNRFTLLWDDKYPCLNDNTNTTKFDRHYIYHTAWAARILARLKPAYHVDISSSLYFNSLVSAFIPIKFYDYRKPDLRLNNLSCESADLCDLHFVDGRVESLSCMHVIEHIGLGRYGDPLDPDGDLKAISELKRVLASGGSLLFVVPIGKPRIMFNAHRIYSYEQIISYFADLDLHEFALIPDNQNDSSIIIDADKELVDRQSYGCGCFWFKKRYGNNDRTYLFKRFRSFTKYLKFITCL